jgi:hypothetical protein
MAAIEIIINIRIGMIPTEDGGIKPKTKWLPGLVMMMQNAGGTWTK